MRGVLLDIDETLTTEGRLTAPAYGALEALHEAGLMVVPVTGRPAGWCDHIARMWPVDAVVGENGAFYFRYDRAAGRLVTRFLAGAAERAENRRRLAADPRLTGIGLAAGERRQGDNEPGKPSSRGRRAANQATPQAVLSRRARETSLRSSPGP